MKRGNVISATYNTDCRFHLWRRKLSYMSNFRRCKGCVPRGDVRWVSESVGKWNTCGIRKMSFSTYIGSTEVFVTDKWMTTVDVPGDADEIKAPFSFVIILFALTRTVRRPNYRLTVCDTVPFVMFNCSEYEV